MNRDDFAKLIHEFAQSAPVHWLENACQQLKRVPDVASVDDVTKSLPVTNNSDLAHLFQKIIVAANGKMSWSTLGHSLDLSAASIRHTEAQRFSELLWSGPLPAEQLAARRIDQVLYDLIQKSRSQIFMVTFAAAKIDRLTEALKGAISRGVKVKLLLEFEDASEGGLSFDAIRAFPKDLVQAVTVLYWPADKRERNQSGRPGKLHAKVAQIDEHVIISSANLTDDAFNRNLEMGVLIRDAKIADKVTGYFDSLKSKGILVEFKS